MPKVKRPYVSDHRRDLAQRTREKILAGARELFRDRGYGATTIQEIATRATVAVPTVYATFGSKRAILLQLLDSIEVVAKQSSLLASLAEHAGDPRMQLRIFVDFHVRLFTLGADMIRIAQLAGEADPDIAALWALGSERRLATCRKLAASLMPERALKDHLSEDRAIDILWALTSPEFYSLFVRDRKWSPDAFGDWLHTVAEEQLLAGPSVRAEESRKPRPPRKRK